MEIFAIPEPNTYSGFNFNEIVYPISNKDIGYLYVMKINDSEYKYGKTKNIENRFKFIQKEYNNAKVIKQYKVNHLTYREELIREHFADIKKECNSIEFVNFNPLEVVDFYACLKINKKTFAAWTIAHKLRLAHN